MNTTHYSRGSILPVILVLAVALGLVFVVDQLSNNRPVEEGEVQEAVVNPELKREYQEALEADIASYGLNIEEIYSPVYWSPDGSGLLITGGKQSSTFNRSSAYIYYVDIEKGTFREVHTHYLRGVPSWHGTNVTFGSENGAYMYAIDTGTVKKISEQGKVPLFSPDGKRIALYDKGIVVYEVASGETVRLTEGEDEIPAAWFSDGTKLVVFRNTGRKLGDGAGYSQALSVYDISSGEYDDIPVPEMVKFRNARFVVQDEILHLTAGWDDGFFDYIVNVAEKKAIRIAETSSMSNQVAVNDQNIFVSTLKGEVKVFDLLMEPVKEYRYTPSNSNIVLLSPQFIGEGKIIAWKGRFSYNDANVVILDPQAQTEVILGPTSTLGGAVYPSPEGGVAVSVEGLKRLKFWNLPE